ncbi:glycosyltransferase [Cyanobium sp. Cruz CV13-4-11]|jgi:glycosyltransferase involved in cell wall biosynthesis|uniref:glycosyltransferase n=1 Tax=unclassified Cyanobium TaxID=2627006 RepID=UPI0020CFA07C|nr:MULTISPECIES: glycosyltransferase [unclassified Cyanobium]MCP9900245.1 glycosyltransferase [Cyanobium sp. Cruz CV11-17]MCP9918558.1 glycosyltransferase [Cyanobium sp. Cruz CV13-4-11]
MRVLHVIPSISPLRGGPSRSVIDMVATLRLQDVDAAILTTNDHGPGLHPDLVTGRWQWHQGVPVLAFPRWSPPVAALREFAFSPALSLWLARNLKRYELLHIHALFSYPCTSAMAQARWAGVPYILRSIGQLSPWSLAQSPGRKRLMLRLIERRNLQRAALLHFTTKAERDEAACLGLVPPSLVLPLGVRGPDLPAQPADHLGPTAPVHFLFLSRLHPKKQLENLLDALALLQRRRPQASWDLAIAGDGEPRYVAALQERARGLGLGERCCWLGFVAGEAKWRALEAADWYVLPSAAENFGIAAVEALAAGTPVILSPEVAVAADVARAGAGLVSASDPEALALTLATALERPSLSRRAAALNLAEKAFSWSTIALQLRDAYRQVLTSSAGR